MTGDIIQSGANGSGYILSQPVHPTFLYESLWCLAGFLLLHILSKRYYKFRGQIFASYIIWYGLGRAWIEGLRTDSLMLGTMRVSQLLAILSVIGGVILLFVFRAMEQRSPKDLFVEEPAPTVPLAAGEDGDETEQASDASPAEAAEDASMMEEEAGSDPETAESEDPTRESAPESDEGKEP